MTALATYILCLVPLTAGAQPVTQAQFEGSARVGALLTPVSFHISCAMHNGKFNNLAIGLDIPNASQLQPVFDVNLFEGPAGVSSKTHLVAKSTSSAASVDFGVGGSFGNNGLPGTTFTFENAMTADTRPKSSLQELRAVADVLSNSSTRLTWKFENAAKGGRPILAEFETSAIKAREIQAATASCKS